MEKNSYISYNGKTIKKSDFNLRYNNRAFLYGDAIFETMFASATRIINFKQHITRAISSMEELKMNVPSEFRTSLFGSQTPPIKDYIIDLINKNRFFKGIRIRMTIFRKPGGLYTPESNDVDYVIETTELESSKYELNQRGIIIDTFTDIRKSVNKLSGIKSTNSLLFTMAGLYKKSRNIDDCLILNEYGSVCECISSNIFMIRDKQLFTPSLKSGCVKGIMREKVIELALDRGLTVFDDCDMSESDLENADEIFITNAISGIKWVLGFRKKRYLLNIVRELYAELVRFQSCDG